MDNNLLVIIDKIKQQLLILEQYKLQKIKRNFNRELFSQDQQYVAFYKQEIETTLDKLTNQVITSPNEINQAEFLAAKLIAQCNALFESLFYDANKDNQFRIRQQAIKATQKRVDYNILPPRERLQEYYTCLRLLNEKIGEHEASLKNTSDADIKLQYVQAIETIGQRKQKCMESIELLEGYLALDLTDN